MLATTSQGQRDYLHFTHEETRHTEIGKLAWDHPGSCRPRQPALESLQERSTVPLLLKDSDSFLAGGKTAALCCKLSPLRTYHHSPSHCLGLL